MQLIADYCFKMRHGVFWALLARLFSIMEDIQL
ncbi:hypothetical protein Y888_00455 [Mixta calida B021323]|nr:hypothetical protein Y888_00455 [Mixta calida B021323]